MHRRRPHKRKDVILVPRHAKIFSDPGGADWMDSTRDRTSLSFLRGSTTRVHLLGKLSLFPAVTQAEDLLPPMKLAVRCCHGQYLHSMPTSLPTTITPVVEQDVIPSKTSANRNNIEREATSDEQLAALSTSSLGAKLLFSGVIATPWRAFR
ncbi:hypothetical protein MTO96_021757 [Rhipicephalus appendiculatus]